MSSDYKILPCGDAALVVKLGNDISVKTGTRVRALMQALSGKEGKGIVDLIPAYCSLTVCFDPLAVSYDKLCRRIARLAAAPESGISDHRRIYSIPVCYGGEFGPDLADVASMTGLGEREVIARHSAAEYFIYMLGFLPGFPYLGGLDPAIAVKRLDSPRQKIPCGSVGIGGSQTGVYPMESPGGWRLIGRTPVRLYDPSREPSVLLHAGDFVRFVPVDRGEFDRIAALVEAGAYLPMMTEE